MPFPVGEVLAVAGGLGGAVGVVELGVRRGWWSAWVGRKLLHMGVGGVVLAYFLSGGSRLVLVGLSLLFVGINALDRALRLTAASRVDPSSWGTVLFPLAVAWTVWWDADRPSTLIFGLGVMFFADPLAALVPRIVRFPSGRPWRVVAQTVVPGKSLEGSLAFLGVALIVGVGSGILRDLPGPAGLWLGGLVLGATWLEAVCTRGLDNLVLPLFLTSWIRGIQSDPVQALAGGVFAVVVGIGAGWRRALTPPAAVAAASMGFTLWNIGAWKMAMPLLAFFVPASLLTRWRGGRRAEVRTPVQVLANGGSATLFALLGQYVPHPAFYVGYVASLAAAAADTFATEVGRGVVPRDILTGRKVRAGTSGGVSLRGFIGSGVGAGLVALGAGPWLTFPNLLGVTGAGIAGSVVDSLLGSAVQGRWRCPVCRRVGETRVHCGVPGTLVRGWPWLDNHGVNALATLFAGMMGWVLGG